MGGFARETSIKVSPHGTLFECCTRSSGQVQQSLRGIGPLGTWVASGGRIAGEAFIMVSPYGTLFQCCTRSSGQVRRSLLSIGPLLYKCSIRSFGMVVRLVVVFGGHSLNFVCNTGYVGIGMEQLVVDVPGCIYYVSEEFRLEPLDYGTVGLFLI